ncbi:hypothetical protein [Bacillus xiapuensis]|uniref:AbrB family transcriptional regulator n=1 Tax=Bacillus xiapuensis TaxID=2014075 RepID=A0ABU6NC18_9BACI|nr:hypothetical protein [Bacillus xiapuensis]
MIKTDDKRTRFLLSIIVAFIGGILFTVLHTPIPWLLGPMVSILIGARLGKFDCIGQAGSAMQV